MAASSSGVRPASAQDAAACLAITAPTSRTRRSVGKSMSRPLTRWLRASMGSAPPTIGSSSSKMTRSSACVRQRLKRLAAFQWATETGMFDIAHHQRRRRTRALHATAAPAHRAGLPASLRRRHPATAFIDPGLCGARPAGHGPARMDRLARPSPPPQVGYGPLKIRKDVRPSEQGRTKVEPGRHCPVRTRFDRPENNLTPL
jgi:hypothetical protein